MRQNEQITKQQLSELAITAILERWPRTADIFHAHAMACVGCAVAPFYTIVDAAVVYKIDPDHFVEEILNVIQHETTEVERSG